MTSETETPFDELPEVLFRDAEGPGLIVCEHASNWIPARYNRLGLDSLALDSHAAWDPGARDIAVKLSRRLHSPMVAARVSRLVYDCNRPPEDKSAIPHSSETIAVPGNRNLDVAGRRERTQSVYQPFCDAVESVIDERRAAGRATVLITVHSFTPLWFGMPRETHIGILHDEDSRMADAMLARASALPNRIVGRNDPYGAADGVTHSLRRYGLKHGLANVMIEIRNDLLRSEDDRIGIVEELLFLLRPALAEMRSDVRLHETCSSTSSTDGDC
ncbi:N-formylglutamate amidohydrolase [Pararhizobium mangrovi]|uniref:N-formylglutamate amidohydrolase n=2 Tax=Pararhizobium mangrovi TaxID=2590452 RepID=A0A506UB23_9HYPH|nr:N-formylglutamate amidohydrolase [Pararhizobium mangrovi]